jgi:hypothetical protein
LLAKDLSEGTTGLFTVLTQKGVRQAYIGRQLLSAFVAEQLGEEGPNFVDEVNLEADKMARQYVGMFHGQLLGFPSSSHSCQYLFGLTLGLMRSKKEQETRPPKRLQDEHCYGASEQQWWKIQHDGAN